MAAPLQPGIQYTLADAKYAVGIVSTRLRNAFDDAESLRVWLAPIPDADLIMFGFTQGELDIIRGTYIGELPGLRTTFNGLTFIKKLWGLGV